MFEYFYNEVLRRTIISFGTLFNNITIKHEDSSDNVVSVVKIPLAYGPTQKFLARINQSPDLNKPFAITLPRMSFEFTGLTYDPSRKVSTVQNFTVKDPDDGFADNINIETEADAIIDFSERNPFGIP